MYKRQAYILATTQEFDKAVFAEALCATANHRGTARQIADVPAILPVSYTHLDVYKRQAYTVFRAVIPKQDFHTSHE